MAGPKYDLHYNFCVLINLMYFVSEISLAVCSKFLSTVISFTFFRFQFVMLGLYFESSYKTLHKVV